MLIQKYPLDFSQLKKGNVITEEELSEIVGLDPDDKRFKLKVLRLREAIEDRLSYEGYPVTLKEDNGDLRILTDSEAAIYNNKRFKDSLNAAIRSYQRMKNVDIANLNSVEKSVYFRKLETQGKYIQSIATTAKTIKLESGRRTPGLLNFG